MEKRDVINGEFARSVIFGFIKVLYDWIGIGMRNMTNLVGVDFIIPELRGNGKTKQELLNHISNVLTDHFKICESAQISMDEREGVINVHVENCCLLPLEKMLRETLDLTSFVICPVVNIVTEAMNRMDLEAEKRTWKIEEEKCHHVIGLVGELQIEKEIKMGGDIWETKEKA